MQQSFAVLRIPILSSNLHIITCPLSTSAILLRYEIHLHVLSFSFILTSFFEDTSYLSIWLELFCTILLHDTKRFGCFKLYSCRCYCSNRSLTIVLVYCSAPLLSSLLIGAAQSRAALDVSLFSISLDLLSLTEPGLMPVKKLNIFCFSSHLLQLLHALPWVHMHWGFPSSHGSWKRDNSR